MIPSDMVLKVGSLEKYNNSIVIASNDMEIGKCINEKCINEQINGLNIGPQSFVDPHLKPQVPQAQTPQAQAPQAPHLLNPVYVGMGASVCVFLMFYVFS